MLKHVSYRASSASLSRSSDFSSRSWSRSANTSPLEDRSLTTRVEDDSPSPFDEYSPPCGPREAPDTVSLISTRSLMSLKLSSSRTTSVSSLSDQATVPVKIYLRRLRCDMEYKTVCLSLRTTCRELVLLLLAKFRLRHRDPNLFFVLMEVTVRAPSDGAPVRRQLVLEDSARPAELQQCRPKGEANFSIGVRRGGLIRVHDAILNPGSQYKSLMVSCTTTADELIQLLLDSHSSREDPKHYSLHVIYKGRGGSQGVDRTLNGSEVPILVQASLPKEGSLMFALRRNISFTLSMKSRVLWRRSFDQSSTDTESEVDDHNSTRASVMSSSSDKSSSSVMSSSSTFSNASSNSSTSSGVSSHSSLTSSSTLSSCSASTASSSGVSSSEGSPDTSPTSKASYRRLTLPPASQQASSGGRPPKPVPRTLFPPLERSASTQTLTKDDSGVVLEETSSSSVDFEAQFSKLSLDETSPSKVDLQKDQTPEVDLKNTSSLRSSLSIEISPSKGDLEKYKTPKVDLEKTLPSNLNLESKSFSNSNLENTSPSRSNPSIETLQSEVTLEKYETQKVDLENILSSKSNLNKQASSKSDLENTSSSRSAFNKQTSSSKVDLEIPRPALASSQSSRIRKAGVRSLSKSSLNLSLVSPLGRSRSRSFLSLVSPERRTSTPKRPPTPVGGRGQETLTRVASAQCTCRHCFYI